MSNERWNSDIAYAFSTHRTCLRVCGLWPLQTQTVFTKTQWIVWTIAQFMILPFIVIDFIWNTHNTGAHIESILYFVTTAITIIKYIFLISKREKLCINVNAAIDDWLSAKDDERTRNIMKKHTLKAKILNSVALFMAMACFCMYVSAVLFINLKQIFFTDPNSMEANATNWVFLIPSGPLGNSITGTQYALILALHIFQTFIICFTQCIVDSFFFHVTVHICGQLELLKNRFETFANEPNTKENRRQKFVSFINRHNELMELYQNLEDTFHFLMLFQFVISTIMLALIGLRISLCLNEKNYVEVMKSTGVMSYLLIELLVNSYGGDFLQKESEGIFYALYATSWFTLPLALMKDLHFAMMRSSIPFRFTGGKFFYVNRETMIYVLKTAASYVSVLRIALRK